MALTKAQAEAIQRAAKQAAAKRAALQKTKISSNEAHAVAGTLHKRPGANPPFKQQDRALLSKRERDALAKNQKENTAKEKATQKQRSFAKGEGKLPIKERVGTKAEYKQFGKEIKTRRDLIAYAKVAKKNQAERAAARAANPTPPQATQAKEAPKVATKKTTAKKTATPPKTQTSGTAKVTDRRTPKEKQLSKAAAMKEVKQNTPKGATKVTDSPKAKTTKPSTAAVKKRTVPNTKAETPKTKSKGKPKTKATTPKPFKDRMAVVEKDLKTQFKAGKAADTRMQTLEEAKAKAPKPMLGPKAPIKGPLVDQPRFFPGPQQAEAVKPARKVTTKVAAAKSAAKSSTAGKAVRAAAKTPIGQAVAKSKVLKVAKVGGKVLKVGARVAQAVEGGKEIAQTVSGQAEKDFRRIQALENRIAVAKGQKPKYTKVGSNRNLLSSVKTDLGVAARIVTGGMAGKSRKDRLQELKAMLAKVQKNPKPSAKPGAVTSGSTNKGGNKGGNASPSLTTGGAYRVKSGDTLSAIASRSGVSLKELRAANPKFTTQAKYKGGSMIFSGTTVSIPKAKKAK